MSSQDPFWVDYQSGSLFDLKSVMSKLKNDLDAVQNSLVEGNSGTKYGLASVKEEENEEGDVYDKPPSQQHTRSQSTTPNQGSDTHWLDYQSGNLFDLKSVVQKLNTETQILANAGRTGCRPTLTGDLTRQLSDHFSEILNKMDDAGTSSPWTTPTVFKFTAQFLDNGAEIKPTVDEIKLNGIDDAGEPFEKDVLRIFKSQRKKNEYMSCVHELLERAASYYGDLPALISDETSSATVLYTYKTLNAAASRLAHELHRRGVRRGDTVAVMLPTDSRYIAVCLSAVLKAGAAVCPIEANLNPLNMKEYKLTDTKSKVVLTTTPYRDCSQFCPNIVLLDTPEFQTILADSIYPIPPAPDQNEAPIASDTAFVIYTSGSTGRPKGVEVQHQNMIQYSASVVTRFRTDSRQYHTRQFNLAPTCAEDQERISTALLFGFDAFLNAYLLSLTLSASWVILRRETIVSGELADRLLPARLTFLHSLPSLMRTLSPGQLPTLKYVEVGGEALPKDVFQAWAIDPNNRVLETTLLVNSYGPTETTITSSRDAVVRGNVLTVGRALPGYRQRVFVAEGVAGGPVIARPAKIGEVGEVYVAGAGVARGYLNRPEVTEKVFITLNDGERWYRTGDEGKHIDASGKIELFGRIDFQVKIRGHRVELGEIEAVMATHERVKEIRCAMVVPISGVEAGQSAIGDSNKVLCAYIVLHYSHGEEDENMIREELDEACKKQLPEYMVPQHYLFMEGILPQSAAGKLAVDKLPRPKIHAVDASDGPLWIPTNPFTADAEAAKVAEIWTTSVTGYTNDPNGNPASFKFLAKHADFLALGGNSLAAALIVSKLRNYSREKYNNISVVDVYKFKKISEFVHHAAGTDIDTEDGKKQAEVDDAWIERYRHGSYAGLVPRSAAGQVFVNIFGTIFQTLWISFLFLFGVIQGFAPLGFYYLSVFVLEILPDSTFIVTTSNGFLYPTVGAFFGIVAWIYASQLFMIVLVIALKWIMIGRYKAGRFRSDSWYGIRRWAMSKAINQLAPMKMMNGTPAITWFYNAMGASIHHSVDMNCGNLITDFDLLSIGEGSVIEDNVDINTCQNLPNGYFEAGRVIIGDMCTVRQFSNVGCKSRLGSCVTIRPQTYFAGEARPDTVWEGLPARQVPDAKVLEVERVWELGAYDEGDNGCGWFMFTMFFYTCGTFCICLQELAPIMLQVLFVFNLGQMIGLITALILCPFVVLAWTPFDILAVIIIKWTLNGFQKIKPGIYTTDSWLVLRYWLIDLLVSRTHKRMNPISHSAIDVWFARAMGATIPDAQGVLITSWAGCNFDLVTLEKFAYLSAEAVVSPMVRRAGGYVTLSTTHFGVAALVGHLAYIAGEVDEPVYIPERVKIGAHVSISTEEVAKKLEPRVTVFGSPPVFVPATSVVEELPTKGSDHCGQTLIFFSRIPHFAVFKFIEGFPAVFILALVIMYIQKRTAATVLANPAPIVLYYFGGLLVAKFIEPALIAAFSWVLICFKPMQPGKMPLWYSWERYVTGNYQLYMNTWQEMLDTFKGTLWATLYYKIAGAHISWSAVGIGSDLYVDDPHLTTVGSGCSFGTSAAFTSHTADAEGGYLEFNTISIGKNVVLGPYTSILRGTVIEDNATTLTLTKPLPNEFISGENNWVGYPMFAVKKHVEDGATTSYFLKSMYKRKAHHHGMTSDDDHLKTIAVVV